MNAPETRSMNRLHRHLILVLLIVANGWGVCCAQPWVRVDWVADGDTIILQDGRHVRYIGIDAPEIDHQYQRAAPLGYAARSTNRQLVAGRQLRLVYDRERHDHYGRTLAYVYRRDGLFVNAELLKQGLAHVSLRPPNTGQQQTLLAAQRNAMQAGRGLWRWVTKDAVPKQPYQGNRRSMRFHAADCPNGKRISPKNRIQLENQWAAFWSGFAPARGCMVFPPAVDDR
jgi:micrococcal nuclease